MHQYSYNYLTFFSTYSYTLKSVQEQVTFFHCAAKRNTSLITEQEEENKAWIGWSAVCDTSKRLPCMVPFWALHDTLPQAKAS